MIPRLRQAYSVMSVVLVVGLLAQFFFAGLAVWTMLHDPGSDFLQFWKLHINNAWYVVGVSILILVALSFLAGHSGKTTGLTALMIPWLMLQAGLAWAPFLPLNGLHPVSGTLLLLYAIYIARRTWAFGNKTADAARA